MENQAKISTEAAEHLRKAIKELRWTALNLEKFYDRVKPDEAPPFSQPSNQLKLFDLEED